jgi:hypothetical protein
MEKGLVPFKGWVEKGPATCRKNGCQREGVGGNSTCYLKKRREQSGSGGWDEEI